MTTISSVVHSIKKRLIIEGPKTCFYCYTPVQYEDVKVSYLLATDSDAKTYDNAVLSCKECFDCRGDLTVFEFIQKASFRQHYSKYNNGL